MRKEDWTHQLRNRLADYGQPAPADAWEEIERRLPARRKTRHMALFRWLAAAAVAAIVAGVGLVYLQQEDRPSPTAVTPIVATLPKPHHETVDNEPAATAITEAPAYALGAAAAEAPALIPEIEVDEPADTTLSIPASDSRQPSSSASQRHDPKIPATTQHASIQETATRRTENKGQWNLSLLAMNTMTGDNVTVNGVRMSEGMTLRFSDAANAYNSAAHRSPVWLADYEERSTHHAPLRLGVAVSRQLSSRWQIETGLAYTRNTSEFVKQMRQHTVTTRQTLHYVGVPLRLGYTIWQQGRLRVYASGGAEADFNVKARQETEGLDSKMRRDRVQFSVGAAAGAQFNLTHQAAVYVEPGAMWYPNNGSPVDNVFKDSPLQPTLQLGVRYEVK